ETVLVVDGAVGLHDVRVGRTVLRDEQGGAAGAGVVLLEAEQQAGETLRLHLPAHVGGGQAAAVVVDAVRHRVGGADLPARRTLGGLAGAIGSGGAGGLHVARHLRPGRHRAAVVVVHAEHVD